MKKFCLVSFCNLYIIPYAKKYIDMILAKGYQCDLLYWDRDSKDNNDYNGCAIIPFMYRFNGTDSIKNKIIGYIRASVFFNKTLKKRKYDGIIFLQSHAAVACKPALQNYCHKYIIDIRDYSLENFIFYRKLEEAIINNAALTVISSPAYRQFLPQRDDYVLAHNYNPFTEDELNYYLKKRKRCSNKRINISFIGTVRFIDMDKKILSRFANDNRFHINYFGKGSDILERFCEDKKIENVSFFGSFNPEKTIEFYCQTDIINNLYGNNSPFLDYALSNKLYHAGQLNLPILVCPMTYMAVLSNKYKMGYIFDIEDKQGPDKLFKWYKNLDFCQLAKDSKQFISDVKKDNNEYFKAVSEFLN